MKKIVQFSINYSDVSANIPRLPANMVDHIDRSGPFHVHFLHLDRFDEVYGWSDGLAIDFGRSSSSRSW